MNNPVKWSGVTPCPKCHCPIPDGYDPAKSKCPFHFAIPLEAYERAEAARRAAQAQEEAR